MNTFDVEGLIDVGSGIEDSHIPALGLRNGMYLRRLPSKFFSLTNSSLIYAEVVLGEFCRAKVAATSNGNIIVASACTCHASAGCSGSKRKSVQP
jgi:hypothetical protein